ncbi:Ribosomal large subunit pseudouridine synthase E [Burkholderia sp. AU4i]|nr:Ribosomal large subunit pseudouridine synthase E [Burkholderia sp. AU4i]
MTDSGRANFSSSFSSTAREDRALNHADANLSYPALAAEPCLRHESDVFIEYDSAPAAQ